MSPVIEPVVLLPDEAIPVAPCVVLSVVPALLPSVVEPLVLPVAGAAPIAVVPVEGAPMAVLPGVVGPARLPPLAVVVDEPSVPDVVPDAPSVEEDDVVPGPALATVPELPGVVLEPVVGQGMVLAGVTVLVCAKAKLAQVPRIEAAATVLRQ